MPEPAKVVAQARAGMAVPTANASRLQATHALGNCYCKRLVSDCRWGFGSSDAVHPVECRYAYAQPSFSFQLS